MKVVLMAAPQSLVKSCRRLSQAVPWSSPLSSKLHCCILVIQSTLYCAPWCVPWCALVNPRHPMGNSAVRIPCVRLPPHNTINHTVIPCVALVLCSLCLVLCSGCSVIQDATSPTNGGGWVSHVYKEARGNNLVASCLATAASGQKPGQEYYSSQSLIQKSCCFSPSRGNAWIPNASQSHLLLGWIPRLNRMMRV